MELCSPKIKKILIFFQKKLFLYFGKWNFFKKLIFQKGTFQARKMKNTYSEKISYILGNGTFLLQA